MRGEIVALIVATSFAAGLNLPATVATLGLLERAEDHRLKEPYVGPSFSSGASRQYVVVRRPELQLGR